MASEYRYEREYDRRTVALLFGLSGNRCAKPDCNNRIVAEPTGLDEAAVLGHIAHIYSRTSKGPRPCPGAKPAAKVINGFDDLILLCRHCHALVDEQENTYTAEEIARWKSRHLARHFRTRSSLLPENHRRQTVLGLGFEVLTADATLFDAGPPVVRTSLVQAGSGSPATVTTTELRCWLQTDAGDNFYLDLTNMLMPCPIGGRTSMLLALSEHGEQVPFSLLSHSTMHWLRVCNSRELYGVLSRGHKISPFITGAIILACLYLLIILIWQVIILRHGIGIWCLAAVFAIVAPVAAFEKLREQLIARRLTQLQDVVLVS